jgi:VIT1/CCC1 family predicted Fe2+/Mn2+ transporter
MSSSLDPHLAFSTSRLNSLRAAVLGANDGIISLSGLVIGVAGATDSRTVLLAAGVAGLLAGAFSMAAGEFISVSTQRDTERAMLAIEKRELRENPEAEMLELVEIYRRKGLTLELAEKVAKELSAKDAFAAHVDAELHIDPNELTNPWQAAFASAAAFVAGALLPLGSIILAPAGFKVPVTFGTVVVALFITGVASAKVTRTPQVQAVVRVVCGGILAMAVTYGIGLLFRV